MILGDILGAAFSARRAGLLTLGSFAMGLLATSCKHPQSRPSEELVVASASPSNRESREKPPWLVKEDAPAVPKGMVWIPKGALVAGTPPGELPRIADQEMEGQQLILNGFFMDVFAYPNEAAAIPLTNVTLEQARALCVERGKRLCSELEWERACKGSSNTEYEYGSRYWADACATGNPAQMLPSGLHYACHSDFGVRDLHGSVWEWTDSPWGRGGPENHVAIRGGNEIHGEVVGRCANARQQAPDDKSSELGFRCCMGERNPAEVVLHVTKGAFLERHNKVDTGFANLVRAALPEQAEKALPKGAPFLVDRIWTWRPMGNEALTVVGGCATTGVQKHCGAVIGRNLAGKWQPLQWVHSGYFSPEAHVDRDPHT
ncbi:MAG TPA: SUMF1/EgtB/PvdO family nonheme iron enzyme, partial [Polyangiaceae bacterium]|nr:SUMF1/EgtB/PvdO family nonheme iron enzyme [Polyangiaceae bacterium]